MHRNFIFLLFGHKYPDDIDGYWKIIDKCHKDK